MSEISEFCGYRLDTRQRLLTGPDGNPIRLRARVFDTLCVLVERAGQPVSKAEILEAVWPGAVVEENNLNQAISTLRRTFGDDRNNPAFIATITGQGYQFVAEVRAVPGSDAGDAAPVPARARLRPAARAGVALAVVAVIVGAVFMLTGRPQLPVVIDLASARLATPFEGSHSQPTLSPDGTLMAFVSRRSGRPQVWVQALPDGTPLQITRGDQPARSPDWSPVDNQILFERPTVDGVPAVWITDSLGTRAPRVVVTDARHPRFAPDGRSLIFQRGLKEVHTTALDGSRQRQLDGIPDRPGFAEAMPAVNARGDIALVLADEGPIGNLWLYRAADGSFRQLTLPAGDISGVLARSPRWLRDGRSILYAAAPEDALNFHLWRVDTDSGETTQLSTGVGGYDEPVVSRDGRTLAYSYSRPLWRLVATDTRTRAERVIVESRTPIVLPQVSSDGASIVWFADNLYTVPVAGGDAVQQTFFPTGEATLPTWSRDRAVIHYYKGRTLHRLDTSTGVSELLLDDFHWSTRNWLSVHGNTIAYQQRTEAAPGGHTVLLDLASGEQTQLEAAVVPGEWTRDGETLLARRKTDGAVVTCSAPQFTCTAVLQDGEPVAGALPHWSSDESRIFFRRLRQDRPGYAHIWAVPREGGEARALVEIGPFKARDMSFGVTADDAIVWPQYDTRGWSEIWTVDLGAASASELEH